MRKYIFTLIITLGLFLSFSVIADASTSSSVAYVEYQNMTEGLYPNDMIVPNETDTNQDNVNIATGDLLIKETDLFLPGKNGLDLEIVRSLDSFETYQNYSHDKYPEVTDYDGYAYKYLNSQGRGAWFYFPSETSMLEAGGDTISICDDCLEYIEISSVDSEIGTMHHYLKLRCTHDEDKKIYTRVPGEWMLTHFDEERTYQTTKYRIHSTSLLSWNRIFKTWRVNTPRFKRTLTYSYIDDGYKDKEYYAEFYDGEAIYPMKWQYYKKGYDDEESNYFYPDDDFYEVVYDITDTLADDVLGAENISDYFYIEDAYGVRFYFTKEHRLFAAKIDRYGNAILYDDSTKTYTDTYGRKVTVNSSGITVNDGTNTKQVVSYSNEKIPYEPDNTLMTLTPYKFRVTKYGEHGNNETAETTTYDMYLRERNLGNVISVEYYIVDKITYSTGAQLLYEYTKDTQKNPVRPVDYTIQDITRLNITKTYFKDGQNVYNEKTYTYPSDYDDTRRINYDVVVEQTADDAKDTYTFSKTKRILTYKRTGDAKETTYGYGSSSSSYKTRLISVTEKYSSSKKREQTFTHDGRGRILTETDGKDKKTYTYNDKGIVLTTSYKRDADTTITVANTISEDGNSIVRSDIKENDVLKQVRKYEYDSFGNITKETVLSPDETESIVNTYDYIYSPNGTSSVISTVKNLKDADGNALSDISVTANYDLFGNVISESDANGSTATYSYDGRNRLLSQTKEGVTTSYSYDAQNNIVILTQPNGTKIKYEYDGFGNTKKISVDSGGGYVTALSYTYDDLLRLLTETEYRTYNANGACTEQYTTTYTYDKFNRETNRVTKDISNNVVYQNGTSYDLSSSNTRNIVTQTVTGDENITPAVYVANYDLRGVLKEEQLKNDDEEYLRTEYTHDYLDNIIEIKDNHAIDNNLDYTVKYEYDYMNNVVKETDITGKFKTTDYDSFGRAVKFTDVGGSGVINYTYDTAGRLIKTTSPADPSLGHDSLTKNYYDANGNLTKVLTFATGNSYQVTEYEYDRLNRPIKVKTYANLAPNGNTENMNADITEYTYDSVGNVLTMSIGSTNPSVTTYAYNGLGQLTSKTDALNKTESYTYNLAGQMLSKTDRNGTTFTYTYNVWGNPLLINAINGEEAESISYTYDILGNCTSMTDKWGTTTYENDFLGRTTQESRTDFRGTIVNEYTYDKFGNVTQASINGQEVNNTFDNLNHLTAQSTGTLSSSFSYNSLNKLASKTLNGITTSYGYNVMGLASSQNTIGSGGNTYLTQSYMYDVRGNISDISTQTVNSSDNIYYSYDGKNRLKNENGIMAENKYDSKDNRINRQGDFIPFEADKTFDLNNRDISCTYDDNGNMTEDEDGVTYEYDLFNRMTERDAGIGAVHTYSYDGDGRRIRKQGITTDVYFIWDGMNLAEEQEYYLGELQSTKKFIYGIGLNYCITDDDVWTYYTNLRGDIAGYVDSEGNVVEYQYDAWGVLQNPTSGDENPFRYAGEYYDEESGFIYLRNRYYDPTKARFTQEDPIQDGLNWYAYCGNNPVNFVDPWGLAGEKYALPYQGTEELTDTIKLRNTAEALGGKVTFNAKTKTATVSFSNKKTASFTVGKDGTKINKHGIMEVSGENFVKKLKIDKIYYQYIEDKKIYLTQFKDTEIHVAYNNKNMVILPGAGKIDSFNTQKVDNVDKIYYKQIYVDQSVDMAASDIADQAGPMISLAYTAASATVQGRGIENVNDANVKLNVTISQNILIHGYIIFLKKSEKNLFYMGSVLK